MPMPNKVFGPRYTDYGFVLNGHPGRFSVEQAMLDATTVHLYAGVVLGRAVLGAQTVTPAFGAGNAGNGVFAAAPTADNNAPAGRYRGVFVDANTINLTGPGDFEDIVQQGAAYNGPVNFQHNVGGVPNVAGDLFTIDVAYAEGTGRYGPLNLAAVNGGQTADAILLIQRGISTAPQRCAILARQQEVNGNLLIWPAGITSNQRKAAEAQLANKGILVRY